jgi:putative Flp pilus-assembly TadE/G-like protein
MRVTRSLRARTDDERGVSLVIVAISLVAIFGMVVLVVDVGVLLVSRRAMTNASDSAALAAAQSCVRDAGDWESQADSYASSNVDGVVTGGIVDSSNCGVSEPGYVTVDYTTTEDLYFTPVLGLADTHDVRTQATAAWGPAGGANPLPIVLNLATFQGDCDIPNVDLGQTCYLWYDNDRFDGSNFGFMNLEQWNVASTAHCSNAGNSQRQAWIEGSWDGDPLPLNYPDPTYVCTDSGIASSAWATLAGRIGDILVFPINDQSSQIMKSGSQIDKYNVIGFASLLLEEVLTVHEAGGDSGSCSFQRNFPNASPLNLDVVGSLQGCFSGAPDDITNVRLSASGNPRCCTLGTHYTYSSTTRTVTWTHPQPRGNVTVSFDWENDGPCGEPPGNSSARCIVVSWQGYQFGGQGAGGGADFGLQSIRLCDLDIAGSCPE